MRRRIRLDRAGLKPGHVEQIGDEAIEPLRLLNDGCNQLHFAFAVQLAGKSLERAGGPENRCKRRLQVMRDRREKCRAKTIGFTPALGLVEVFDKFHALDRKSRLIRKRVEQASLVRCEKRPRLVAVDTDNADGPATRTHGQEEPLGAWQRVRPAPGRTVMLPGPFGGGKIGLIQNILGRITCLHRDRAVFRQQQDNSGPSRARLPDTLSPTARHQACRRLIACG